MINPLPLLAVSFVAGCLGSILGLGGGIILTPILTLGFGIDIRYAVGVSIVSVIATSSGAAASYVRDRLTNLRLAILLEVATTLGALGGVVLSAYIRSDWLYIFFALILFQSAFFMARRSEPKATTVGADLWATRLRLNSGYPDVALGREVEYFVKRLPLGCSLMLFAGLVSGLLGIGSGPLKVLAMDSAMGLPIKVSSATSNFMIGVTAAASAWAYYFKGDVLPELAAPVALGVFMGARVGARLLMVLPAKVIRRLFLLVLIVMGVQMGLRGWKGI